MLVESICIVLIIGFICFAFLRSGRNEYALAAAPLVILPLCHALVFVVRDIFNIVIGPNLRAGIDVFGLAVAISLFGLMSAKLKTRKSKAGYLLVCGGFTVVLALIFIFDHYAPHL